MTRESEVRDARITRVLRPRKGPSEYDEFYNVIFELVETRWLEVGPDLDSCTFEIRARPTGDSCETLETSEAESLVGETIQEILITRGSNSIFLLLNSDRVAWVSDEEGGTIIEVAQAWELLQPGYGFLPDDFYSYWDPSSPLPPDLFGRSDN